MQTSKFLLPVGGCQGSALRCSREVPPLLQGSAPAAPGKCPRCSREVPPAAPGKCSVRRSAAENLRQSAVGGRRPNYRWGGRNGDGRGYSDGRGNGDTGFVFLGISHSMELVSWKLLHFFPTLTLNPS